MKEGQRRFRGSPFVKLLCSGEEEEYMSLPPSRNGLVAPLLEPEEDDSPLLPLTLRCSTSNTTLQLTTVGSNLFPVKSLDYEFSSK